MSRAQDIEALDDYIHGNTPDADAAAFEERLFEAAAEGHAAAAEFVDNLERHASWLAAKGQFAEAYTRAGVEALLARESNIHRIDIVGEGRIEVREWKPDTKRVVMRLGVDLRGYEQVEVTARKPGVREPIITFRDVACDPTDGNLYAVCLEPVARMSFTSGDLEWQITAQRGGKREKVREYLTQWVPDTKR